MATNPTTPAPNTSLHRTPAAAPPSPVSSKPFGDRTLIEPMLIRGRRILSFALASCLVGMAGSCGPCGAPLIPGVNWDPPQRQLQEPPEVTKERINRFQGLTSAMTLDAVVGRCGQPTQKNRGNPIEWLYSLQDKSTIVVGAGPTGMLIYIYRVGPDGRHEYFLGGQ